MLRELAVQNLALIEDVRVELQPGFCAWTGETGAGKTLLLAALGLLLGERGSAELLRTGAGELRVTGRFELPDEPQRRAVGELLGSELADEELVVTRRLNQAGRSTAHVNEQPVAVATLRQLGSLLVDIHGQRESQSLLEPAYQLQLLDAFGELDALRQQYLARAERIRELRRRFSDLTAQRQQRQRELALLAFEQEELAAAQLSAGELKELAGERERLVHAQALREFAVAGRSRLHDDDESVVDALGKLLKDAERWQAVDPRLEDAARALAELIAQTRDLADLFRVLEERWEADPARLEEVEQRLRLLRRLEAKYGKDVEQLLEYLTTLDEQQQRLKREETDAEQVRAELERAFADLHRAAGDLSKQRQKTAKKLAAETRKHLADLGMAEAQLEAVLEPVSLGDDALTAEIPAWGVERLELMLAANRGEPARPLRKVASGGELSRTMLALKTVLAAHDHVPTLIFDEIDANVGGRLGDVLGQKLAALGRGRQIVCVTHLPQVASYARHQWTIRKRRRGQRTATSIELLGDAERLEELASMLRGEARGETTRQEAAAMLAAAKRKW
ncbi:MAG: DNA repair protein RecN [Planctomycetia bacterium]|nr:DNA repair protein RecN [Planctomycetia bacterium]